MKKTKKAVSLILAFAMVLSAMLGCMTVSSFAADEGQGLEETSNAIVTESVKRSNGEVSLKLTGSQEWMEAITAVTLNGKAVDAGDYSVDTKESELVIKSNAFDTESEITPKYGKYEIGIEAEGFPTVTKEIDVKFYGSNSFTIRLIAKDGSVKETKTFTKDQIESMAKDEATGGEGIIYSTACSMTGSRAFKGDGAYLSALIEAAGFTEGEDFNPNTTMVKFRTNDSNNETDKNDDPTVESYFSMINTPYNALMADRYYFQDLYNSNSDLYKVYAESANIDSEDKEAVAAHTLKLREAMAKSDKVKVQSMIAYQFVEDPNVDLDDKPLTDVEYDENLAADKCFRFLLGTAMVTEDGKELSSTENTTMRATYQVYGIDLVEEPAVLTFDTTPANADITLTDIAGNEIEPNKDGTYSVTAGKSSYKYTYTVSAPGYVKKTGTVAVTGDQTAKVYLDTQNGTGILTESVERSNGEVPLKLTGSQEWMEAITAVTLNGKAVDAGDYSVDTKESELVIKSNAFDTESEITPKYGKYEIGIEAEGFPTVTKEIDVKFYGSNSFTIRLIAKDGSVKETKTFTKDQIESMAKDEATGGEGIIYSTACSMTGSRAFKGDGAYLSALIEAAGFTEGEDFNPNTTMVKFRTNDSNNETDKNDDPTVESYFSMINTPYNALMADRYYFQDLYNSNSDLYKVYAESANIDSEDKEAVAAHTLKLREAMAKSDKVKVQSMIAYQFVEDPNVDLDDKPLTDVEYDENLAADKCFRFLLGTAMVTEDGKELSSTENTTMRATYQVYGIDLVEEPAVLTFDTTPANADITLTDIAGNEIEPNKDGTYSVTAGKSSYKYTYTVSAPGYVKKTGTVAVTGDQTVEVSLSRESSGGGGGGSAVAKDYTVTFDSNGGSDVAKQTVTSGEKVNKPADPTREGYEFAGWYTDSKLTTAYDFSSKVTKSITLYAKWTEKGAEPEPSTSFKDVAADAWYAEYVSYLAGKGIVNGKTADTFAPDAQITRAEFIKIIAGVAGADVSGKSSSRFSDVASDAWYAPYVAWGVENGIINGTSETTFHPNGNISRQDMATMIKRYTDFAKFTLPTDTAAVNFTDSAQISSYAADAVKAMQQAGIINGKGGNTFAPKDNATRAEACKMLTVLMKMMEA